MDEGANRVLGIMTAILVARHLKNPAELFGYKASPFTESLLAGAIRMAQRILYKIDEMLTK